MRDVLIIAETYDAAAVLPAYRWVTRQPDGRVALATGGEAPLIGVTDEDGGRDGVVAVWRLGQARVAYGARVTAGAKVTSDAQGRAVPARAGDQVGGVAERSGYGGDVGEVLLCVSQADRTPSDDQALRDTVDGAVQVQSVRVADRDLLVAGTSGEERAVTIPGISLRDADRLIGPANAITEIQVSGDGVSVRRLFGRAVIEVARAASPGSPGGTLDQAAVDARIRALVDPYAVVGSDAVLPFDELAPVNVLAVGTFVAGAGAGALAGTVGVADAGLDFSTAGQDFHVGTLVQSAADHRIEVHVSNHAERAYYEHYTIEIGAVRLLIRDADEVAVLGGGTTAYKYHREAADMTVGVRYTAGVLAPVGLDNFVPAGEIPDGQWLGRAGGKPAWLALPDQRAPAAESITLAMLAAAVVARLIPTGGEVGQFLARDGAGVAWGTPEKWSPDEHQQEVFGAFRDGGWSNEGSDEASAAWVSATAYTSDPADLVLSSVTFHQRGQNPGAVLIQNRHVLIRVPMDIDWAPSEDRYRLWVGSAEIYSSDYAAATSSVHLSSTWTSLASDSTYDYYYVTVRDIAGSQSWFIQRFDTFRVDWRRVENTPADWAERGNTTIPVPTALLPRTPHVRSVHDGPAIGLTATNSGHLTQGVFTLFDPAFDLTASSASRGELDVEAVLTWTTRSDEGLGFGPDAADRYRITDIVFASTLRALGDYAAATASTWLEVGNGVDLYRGVDKLGKISLYLAKNSQGHLGYFLRDGGGGTAGLNYSVSMSLGVQWSPTDSG